MAGQHSQDYYGAMPSASYPPPQLKAPGAQPSVTGRDQAGAAAQGENSQQLQKREQQLLKAFWMRERQEIERVKDFKNHQFPITRIRRIMKGDSDVRMVSPEVPVLFSKGCEMLIMELTVRSWTHTAKNRRKVVHKNDIATAISRTDIFDFLVEIVQRDELKEAEGPGMPRARMPVEKPADPVSYGGLYSLPQPEDPPARPPNVALIVGRSAEHQGPGMPRAAMPVRLTRADPRSYGGLYYLPPPRKPPAIPPNVAVMVGRPADDLRIDLTRNFKQTRPISTFYEAQQPLQEMLQHPQMRKIARGAPAHGN